MTPIEQLSQIIPALNELVGRIRYVQLQDPTPCAEFTVHDVLDHMMLLGGTFAPLFRGETPTAVKVPVVYGWVPAEEFTATMNDLLCAVHSPGALDRTIAGPFGEVDGDTFARFVAFDGLIHGWDLATATGQPWAPPLDVTSAVDAFARQAVSPAMRDGVTFKEPTEEPVAGTPLELLVAFSGRAV